MADASAIASGDDVEIRAKHGFSHHLCPNQPFDCHTPNSQFCVLWLGLNVQIPLAYRILNAERAIQMPFDEWSGVRQRRSY
jgi:hypothetical protein